MIMPKRVYPGFQTLAPAVAFLACGCELIYLAAIDQATSLGGSPVHDTDGA